MYEAEVYFVHDDHLLVWIGTGEEDGCLVAVMEVGEDGVWYRSKRPAA